jgi:hypothetical protein
MGQEVSLEPFLEVCRAAIRTLRAHWSRTQNHPALAGTTHESGLHPND